MLVYLDTNIWIYAYEESQEFGTSARRLFRDLHSGKHRLAASLVTLGELLVLPARTRNTFATAAYRRLFSSSQLVVLPYTAAAAEFYADLRAAQRLKPLDALHLATAAAASVHVFVTEDRTLQSAKAPGIGQIVSLAAVSQALA